MESNNILVLLLLYFKYILMPIHFVLLLSDIFNTGLLLVTEYIHIVVLVF